MKRTLGMLMAAGVSATSLVALSAPAANAASCTVTNTSKSETVTCTALGGDEFRAAATCRRTSSSTYSYVAYGPWRSTNGASSKATCNQASDDYRDSSNIQLR